MLKQFGRAIVCSDAAAEAARYGFTAVDRPEGFLILAVASLGDQITELNSPPEVCKLKCCEVVYKLLQGLHHLCCNSMRHAGSEVLGRKEAWGEGIGTKDD